MLAQTTRAASLAAVTLLSVGLAGAAEPALRIVPPAHDHFHPPHHQPLPVFGMHSYNSGYGERIVRVRPGGIAWDLGLERGDTILRLNHKRLNWHGSWEFALRRAMRNGGHIVLLVRDVRTHRVVSRHVDLDPHGHVIEGPIGPVTPKAAPVARVTPRNRIIDATPQPRDRKLRRVGFRGRN